MGHSDNHKVGFGQEAIQRGRLILFDKGLLILPAWIHTDHAHAKAMTEARRFMADRTRNRWNAQRGRLELSKIFDWYGDDFRQGHRAIASLPAFAARHADLLADAPADRERIRSEKVDIEFLDYDWALNDAR